MKTMTTHERFARMYAHREADRVPFLDYAWRDAVAEWQAQGLPTSDYYAYFDLDKTACINLDNSPRYPQKILEETPEYVIRTTAWGATQRVWKYTTSTPENLDFKVKDAIAWQEAKARMGTEDDRIPWDRLKNEYPVWRKENRWISGGFWFGFDITHSGMTGTETLLVAMLEEPEWVMDMFRQELENDIILMDRVWDAGYHFDELTWPDDMGYKNTQFFSLPMYRELLKPFHQKAIDWAHAHGIPARMHSCGDIMPLVPELAGMGLDALNPLEVKAGMDPIALKRQYGKNLVLHGGMNAAIWTDPDAAIAEMERIMPVMKQDGGYIFASDHSIPRGVTLEGFTRIIDAYKRLGSY